MGQFYRTLLVLLAGGVAFGMQGRLSPHIVPQHYNLNITTLVNMANAPYVGVVGIQLLALEPTRVIRLHIKTLEIEVPDGIRLVHRASGQLWAVANVSKLPEEQQLMLELEQPLRQREVYELRIAFVGKLNRNNLGYYRSSYVDPDTTLTQWLSATQFEPNHARDGFPCFDDPMFKTTWNISLVHHRSFTALSNMPVLAQRKYSEHNADMVWTVFEPSIAMPTYLVAFSIHKFHKRRSNSSRTEFNTWARPHAHNHTVYAAAIAPKLLDFYEQFFELPFPLPKIDQLALPDFAHESTESWGLNTFAERTLLYDERRSSLVDKQRVALNVAKQVVHQWFGNLVSIAWWHDVWLKNAFAVYMAGFGLELLEPDWQYLQRRPLQFEFAILERDAHVYTHAVSMPVADESEIWAAYDRNSLQKAVVLLGMLHRLVGDQIMMRTLRSYLRSYANKTATHLDFWASAQHETDRAGSLPKGLEIRRIMESWTHQLGYPLLTVTRDYERGTALVEQRRFFAAPSHSTDEPAMGLAKGAAYCWWVPLSYTHARERNFNHTLPRSWLTCRDDDTPIGPVPLLQVGAAADWLLVNLRISALCRINYDARNWQLLTATLAGADYRSIDMLNRAQLVDDALNLAWSGLMHYNVSLALIRFLRHEDEYVVWAAAVRSLDKLNNVLKHTSGYPVFKTFMRSLLRPKFEQLFVTQTANASLGMLFRSVIMQQACQYELPACVSRARAEYVKLLVQEDSALPVDMHKTVYCTAIQYGGDSDWTQLKHMYTHSNLAAEQSSMLSGLGCSRDIWSLERVLKWTFGGKLIRQHAAESVFAAVLRNPVGYHLAKKFVIDNIRVIRDFCHNSTERIIDLIRPLFEQISTQFDLQHLTKFMASHLHNLPGIERSKKLLLERGMNNIHWRATKYLELMQAIRALLLPEQLSTSS